MRSFQKAHHLYGGNASKPYQKLTKWAQQNTPNVHGFCKERPGNRSKACEINSKISKKTTKIKNFVTKKFHYINNNTSGLMSLHPPTIDPIYRPGTLIFGGPNVKNYIPAKFKYTPGMLLFWWNSCMKINEKMRNKFQSSLWVCSKQMFKK